MFGIAVQVKSLLKPVYTSTMIHVQLISINKNNLTDFKNNEHTSLYALKSIHLTKLQKEKIKTLQVNEHIL